MSFVSLEMAGILWGFSCIAGFGFLVLIRDVGCLDDLFFVWFVFVLLLMLFYDLGGLLFCFEWSGTCGVFLMRLDSSC